MAGVDVRSSQECFRADVTGEPLKNGRLGLGVDGEADGFLHGAVDDGLCDAPLLAARRLVCLGGPAALRRR